MVIIPGIPPLTQGGRINQKPVFSIRTLVLKPFVLRPTFLATGSLPVFGMKTVGGSLMFLKYL
jgi:hypothetical protein